jgi:hypothetical protein
MNGSRIELNQMGDKFQMSEQVKVYGGDENVVDPD